MRELIQRRTCFCVLLPTLDPPLRPTSIKRSLQFSSINTYIFRGIATRTSRLSPIKLTDKTTWPKKVPKSFWDELENQRLYLDWLGDKLSFKSREDWYKVRTRDFENHHGRVLLALKYNGSPAKAVSSIYSDYPYVPWLFRKVPKGFFEHRDNRQKYIDWLVEKVGVRSLSELKWDHFIENHGTGLLLAYGGSPQAVLQSLNASDETNVLPRRRMDPNHWRPLENQRVRMNEIGLKIGVTGSDLSPWYNIDQATLIELGCPRSVLRLYGYSHSKMLRVLYPDYDWQPWLFKSSPKTSIDDYAFLDEYPPFTLSSNRTKE